MNVKLLMGLLCTLGTAARGQVQSTVISPSLLRTAQGYVLGQNAALSGINALGFNPAATFSDRFEFASQYQTLPLDTRAYLGGLSVPLRSLRTTLTFGYLGLSSTNFDRRDANGVSVGTFDFHDDLFAVYATHQLSRSAKSFYIGGGLKLLRAKIDDASGTGYACDGGLYYRISRPLTLSVAVLNVGRAPSLAGGSSRLPQTLSLGATFTSRAPIDLGVDFAQEMLQRRQTFGVSAETALTSWFRLRGRYGFTPSSGGAVEASHTLALGVGLRFLSAHTIDYTFQPFDQSLREAGAAGSHFITLTLRWGGPAAKETPSILKQASAEDSLNELVLHD